MTHTERAQELRAWLQAVSPSVPDELALQRQSLFDVWDTETAYPLGRLARCPLDGQLYRATSPVTIPASTDWQPSIMPTIWALVEVPV